MPQTFTFDPDLYLTSAVRSIQEYVETALDLDGSTTDPYKISMEYPDVVELAKSKVPLQTTLIHFDIEEVRQQIFGFGDNVVDDEIAVVPGSDPIEETMVEAVARCHYIYFDVGVWASPESGGPTARMEAREVLDNLFNGPAALRACQEATDGIEIQSFTGGRNVIDSINDLPIFRTVDLALNVRVYSRYRKFPIPVIEDIGQYPQIVIDDETIVDP